MAEFNTVHIVSLENASRFFSGAPVKICHIPVNFFMTIAKIFHNPSKVSYVDLSSNLDIRQHRAVRDSDNVAIQIGRY